MPRSDKRRSEVEHVHFHVIPKPNQEEGLGIRWNSKKPSTEEREATAKKMLERLQNIN